MRKEDKHFDQNRPYRSTLHSSLSQHYTHCSPSRSKLCAQNTQKINIKMPRVYPARMSTGGRTPRSVRLARLETRNAIEQNLKCVPPVAANSPTSISVIVDSFRYIRRRKNTFKAKNVQLDRRTSLMPLFKGWKRVMKKKGQNMDDYKKLLFSRQRAN